MADIIKTYEKSYRIEDGIEDGIVRFRRWNGQIFPFAWRGKIASYRPRHECTYAGLMESDDN